MGPAQPRRSWRTLRAIACAAALWLPTSAAAQIDEAFGTLGALCAKIATGDEAFLKRVEAAVASDKIRYTLQDNSNPLIHTDSGLKIARENVAAARTDIRNIEANLVQARKDAKGADALDSDIKFFEDKLRTLQAERLALHTGKDGKPGIDDLDRRIAEADRKLADKALGPGPDRTAIQNGRNDMDSERAVLLARKQVVAEEFGLAQSELARVKAARQKIWQVDYIRRLESDLEVARDRLRKALESEKEWQALLDRQRAAAAVILLGDDQVRACLANRRKELAAAAAKPPDPPAPPTPPPAATATFSLNGSWAGTCPQYNVKVSGNFRMSAASGNMQGSFSGSVSGPIAGKIDGAGQLVAQGGGAGGDGQSVRWSGSIAQSGSRWGGSGRWTSSGGPGGNCSGTWQSQ